eukprot:466762_1
MVSPKLKILVVLAALLITAFDVSGKRGRGYDHHERPRKRQKLNNEPTDQDDDHNSNSHSNSRNTNVLDTPRPQNQNQINDSFTPTANAIPNGSNRPSIDRSDTNNGYGQQPTTTQQTNNVSHHTSTGDNYDLELSQHIVETTRSITQSMIDESNREFSAYQSDLDQIMKPNICTDQTNCFTMFKKILEEIEKRDDKYVAMLKNNYYDKPLLNRFSEMMENEEHQNDMSQQHQHKKSQQYEINMNQAVETNAHQPSQTSYTNPLSTISMSASPSPPKIHPGSYNQQYTVNEHAILMSTLETSPTTQKLQNINYLFEATTASTGQTIPVTVNIQEPEKKNTQNTDWTCSTCTFENSFIVQICEICGMKKSQLPSQAS